jgi:hypothetical protein
MNVTGTTIELDDVRLVFVGRNPDQPGVTYIGFRNEHGEDTKIKISREARAALIDLLMNPREPVADFPHHKQWRMVRRQA